MSTRTSPVAAAPRLEPIPGIGSAIAMTVGILVGMVAPFALIYWLGGWVPNLVATLSSHHVGTVLVAGSIVFLTAKASYEIRTWLRHRKENRYA